MRRCEEYVKAGADVLFVEALRTPEERLERAGRELSVPLLYNYVENRQVPVAVSAGTWKASASRLSSSPPAPC